MNEIFIKHRKPRELLYNKSKYVPFLTNIIRFNFLITVDFILGNLKILPCLFNDTECLKSIDLSCFRKILTWSR